MALVYIKNNRNLNNMNIETEIIQWLHSKDVDCSETGQVYTQYGNQFNIVEIIKEFIVEKTILK